jgi:2-oxoglutarate dehydrogenase E2 component (dihydrolipoamide succinyltransferase)
MSTPILNPPQSGILGMHKIARRPMAVGDKVEIRPMMYVAHLLRPPHRRRPAKR